MQNDKKRLSVFLIITFVLMFATHGLIFLLLKHTGLVWNEFPLNALGIIGGGAPAFAALFVVFKMYEEKEIKRYWKRVYLFRVPVQWWLLALFFPLAAGFIINSLVARSIAVPALTAADLYTFPLIFATMIFAGGAEELGWRGIMQDILSKKTRLLVVSILIGLVWGVWHLPLFLIDVFAHYDYSFLTYLFATMMFSTYLTLLVYKTQSVGLAIIMHASMNAFANLGFRIPMINDPEVIAAMVIISLPGALFLSRSSTGDRGDDSN